MASSTHGRAVGGVGDTDLHLHLQTSPPRIVFGDNDDDDENVDDAEATVNTIIDTTTINPNDQRQFSRSPHPYYRISQRIAAERGISRSPTRKEYHQASDSGSLNGNAGAAQKRRRNGNGNSNGWSRISPRASSESGTEADDESTGLLKGLPAPPTRSLRKGLWNTAGRDDPAHWLQHETSSTWSLFVRSPLKQTPKRTLSEESIHSSVSSIARGVVARRKRNEISRRLTETALLLSVGVVVLLQDDVRAYAYSWRKGESYLLRYSNVHRLTFSQNCAPHSV